MILIPSRLTHLENVEKLITTNMLSAT